MKLPPSSSPICLGRGMEGWRRWMVERREGLKDLENGWVNEWGVLDYRHRMDGRMDEWMDGWGVQKAGLSVCLHPRMPDRPCRQCLLSMNPSHMVPLHFNTHSLANTHSLVSLSLWGPVTDKMHSLAPYPNLNLILPLKPIINPQTALYEFPTSTEGFRFLVTRWWRCSVTFRVIWCLILICLVYNITIWVRERKGQGVN